METIRVVADVSASNGDALNFFVPTGSLKPPIVSLGDNSGFPYVRDVYARGKEYIGMQGVHVTVRFDGEARGDGLAVNITQPDMSGNTTVIPLKSSVIPPQSDTIIPNIGEVKRVCLQTWMGTFVCAEGGGGNLVVVNRPVAAEWETFELHRLDENNITLKAHNGQYLCAENGGGTFVVANRGEAKEWERFGLLIDANGLVALSAYNGQFLCADSSGVLMANRNEAKEWEAFRIVDPSNITREQTRIDVNVYKIRTAPIWHTGTVIDDREYYFHTSNRVEITTPRGMDLIHHRTMVRLVPGNLDRVRSVLDTVINRWNGTRYDLGGHNCNFFTDDLIKSLGAPGLDQEYLNASGLAKGLRQYPGGSFLQELIVKWPMDDKRLDQAFMDDIQKLVNLPNDIRKEIERFFDHNGIPVPWRW